MKLLFIKNVFCKMFTANTYIANFFICNFSHSILLALRDILEGFCPQGTKKYLNILKEYKMYSVVGQMAPGCSVLESNTHASSLIIDWGNLVEDSRLIDKERDI